MKMKRILSIALALLMLAVMLPVTALAAEDECSHEPDENGYYSRVEIKNGNTTEYHYATCSKCGMPMSGEHQWGEDDHCTVCGVDKNCDHDIHYFASVVVKSYYDGVTTHVEYIDYHQTNVCSKCGTTIEGDHTYDENDNCTVCGFHKHTHEITAYDQLNEGMHFELCSQCDVRIGRPHTYDADKKCTACGYIDHPHSFVTGEYRNEYRHTVKCADCPFTDTQEHNYNGENSTCTVCGSINHTHNFDLSSTPEQYDAEDHVWKCNIGSCKALQLGMHCMNENNVCYQCGYSSSAQPTQPTQPEDPTPAAVICLHACNTCGGCTAVNACNGKACTCDVKNAPTVTAVKATISSDQPMGDVTVVANEIKNAAKVTESIKAAAGSSIPDGLTLDLVAAVFDIHLEMSGEIVPAGNPVTVTLPVGTDCAKAISEGKMVFIHFGKDNNTVYSAGGKAGTTPLTVDVTAGTITFTANEFSPFALLSVSTPSSEPQVTVTVGSDETEGQKNPSTGAASNSLIGLAVAVAGMTILGSAVLLRKK